MISLRNNMFELAERLVGIYKVNHMTKSVTVENLDYLGLQRQQHRLQAVPGGQGHGQAQQQRQMGPGMGVGNQAQMRPTQTQWPMSTESQALAQSQPQTEQVLASEPTAAVVDASIMEESTIRQD